MGRGETRGSEGRKKLKKNKITEEVAYPVARKGSEG